MKNMKKFEKLSSLFEKEELLYCEGEKNTNEYNINYHGSWNWL